MWLSSTRVILGPALLWQGARVRRNVLRMAEPEGPRAGEAGSGPPLSLLILGDSSAAGVGCTKQEQALAGVLRDRLARRHALRWRLHARTGWTTDEAEETLPELGDAVYDLVVISLGVNDITTETGIDRWLATYGRVIDALRTRNAARRFLISGLPPMGMFPALPQPLRWYMGRQKAAHERALAEWAAARPGLIHVPLDFPADVSEMAEDGFHPGPAIYARWAEAILARVETAPGRPVSEPPGLAQQPEAGS